MPTLARTAVLAGGQSGPAVDLSLRIAIRYQSKVISCSHGLATNILFACLETMLVQRISGRVKLKLDYEDVVEQKSWIS
jgi:hypothetical protein